MAGLQGTKANRKLENDTKMVPFPPRKRIPGDKDSSMGSEGGSTALRIRAAQVAGDGTRRLPGLLIGDTERTPGISRIPWISSDASDGAVSLSFFFRVLVVWWV